MTTSPGWLPPAFPAISAPGWAALPSSGLTVRLGGIDLVTSDVTPAPATPYYILLDMVGWDAGASDGADSEDHPSGDGQIAGPQKLEPLSVSIQLGVVSEAEGPASQGAAMDALARVRRDLLVVSEPARGVTREADVRVTQRQETRISPTAARVTLTLVADDPLRYASGTRPLSNGAQTLINRGDEVAWPVLELVGPHSAVTISHPGGSWTLPALGAGVERTVDCRHGRVFNGAGNQVFGAGAGSGPWPRVPADGSHWTVSGLGAGAARMRRWEAWS